MTAYHRIGGSYLVVDFQASRQTGSSSQLLRRILDLPIHQKREQEVAEVGKLGRFYDFLLDAAEYRRHQVIKRRYNVIWKDW
jgi:hypothetical protein